MNLFLFLSGAIFIWAILSEKSCQKHGIWKKYKKWDSHIGELSIEGVFKPSVHYDIERLKGGHWSLELLGGPKLEGGPQTSLHTIIDFLHVVRHTQIYLIQFVNMAVVRHTWPL